LNPNSFPLHECRLPALRFSRVEFASFSWFSFITSHPTPISSIVCFGHFMQQIRQTGFCFTGHVLISQDTHSRWQW
jgi:hypothetical protein